MKKVNYSNLTEKQRRFVEAYVGEARGNATEAARLAGYKKPHPQGAENIQKPTVKAGITDRLKIAAAAGDIPDATETLRLIGEVARGNIGDFLDVTGRQAVINMSKAEEAGKLHLIRDVEFGKGGIKIKLEPRLEALTLLARHHKLLTDKVDYNGEVCVTFDGEDKLKDEGE